MASKVQEIKKKLQAAQPVTTGSSATAQGSSSGSRVRDIKRKMVADVDGEYIQSFLSDFRDHISNTQREYEGLNWQNARSEEARVSRANASTHINQRARKVRTYLDAYKEDIPEEQYTALKQYLDDFDAFQNQSAASFRNAYAQFSQFETEDDYRAFTTFQKQLGEDIPAIDQQIADLEAEYETFDWTDASQREKMREYESKISQMKVYRRQAAAVQANKAAQEDLENRLATYSKNADWDKLSKGIDVSADPDRKSDYSIVFELSRTNVAYDKETALANGTPEAEWNDIDQKRRYIGKKYGVDLYADIYDNVNIFNEIMSMLDDYSFEGGELSQQLWGERIGNSFKNMRHLTEDEQKVLNYIFYTQGRDAALQWHNSRMNIYQDLANGVLTEEMLKWGKEAPLRSSLASVAMSIGSGFEQIGDWISGDYNNSLARASSAIRSGVSEKIDLMIGNWDAFDFLYSTGMSGVDSWAASAFGKAGSVVLGLSAAAQATNDAMDRGMPKKQAFWHGLMSGVFECLFERWSIGNFKALKEVESEYFKDAVKNLAKTMLVNATEEACTEVANIAYDTIVNGDFSQYEAMLLQNVTDGMSEHEAKRNTALQLGGQVAEAAASGALMGFGFGVTGLSQGALKKASRKVRFNKALKNFENTQLKEFAPLIIAEALDINPDNAQAMQLKAQLDSGKELSTGDLKALHTLAKESTIAVDSETAANRLKELGETGDVAAISKAAAKQAVGEKLTAAEKKILSQSQYAQQVVEELTKQQEAVFDTAETQPNTTQQTNSADTDSMSTPTENVTETPYEVSVDNQTIQKSTGEAVTLQKISSIKNGKMTFRTDAGTEVDAADVSYASEDEAIVYETVAQLCSNASAANLLVDAFHTGQVPGDIYARGIQEAYSYGKFNISQDDMMKHGSYVKDLTEHQRNVAYKMGQLFAGEQISREVAAIRKHKKSGQKAAGKVYFDNGNGNVMAFEDVKRVLTDKQSAGVNGAIALQKLGIGGDIYFFESYINSERMRVYKNNNGKEVKAPNGWYDPSDGSIHIDINAGNDGKGTILFTVAHELTHYIRQWSPAKFKVLANFLMQEYSKKGVNINTLVYDQVAKAKRNGRTISYDTAYEEVVADSMEIMLSDGKVMEKLAKLKAQDKTLWQKIKDFINELAAKIRMAYEGMAPDSVEGRHVFEMVDAVERLQDLFTEGLIEASENYQSSLTPGEESMVVSENGDPVAYSSENGSVLLSMRTYEENGREAFRDYLQKCVSSKKLTKSEMQEMLDGIEEIFQTCKEFKDKYAPFSAWSDAAVVRDTYGKPVFSVVTPNGDYKMNLDFSLVCKKRRTLDAVFNEMSRRGIIDDFELGQKTVVKINETIRKYGLETACSLCFVDAKRFRQASMADSFTRLYNELVLSLVPEDQRRSIDHFNFAGYETISKVESGIHTWDASKLDFSHIDHVLKTYGSRTVEYKAAQYIKSHREGRKLLLRGDFMSSAGFDAVKINNKDILRLYNAKKGAGGPKAAFGDVQYMNEIIQRARSWTPKKAYSVGGVRIQSFSDYIPRMVFDYTQMIYDLAATKLPAHAYTKEALFVKQFGLTGVKINMSLIPAIAEGGIAPGLDTNGNYVWAGESFDYETAKEIQNADGYTENCGTICVGVSKQHIEKLLRDPNIRMVIPYHKSGLNPIVAHMNKIAEFHDYTNDQRTKGKDGKALDKDFDFSKALHDMGENADPKAAADRYLKWCAANGYTPKFAEFAMEDNYYKLLSDFTLYDKDGNYVPQREVRAVFPKADSAFGSMKSLIEEGLQEDAVVEGKRDKSLSAIVDEIQQTIPRTETEIEETQVEQADRDLEADAKLSDRDYQNVVGKAVNQFGTTTDFAEAGFILPSGEMLKFTDDRHRGERIYDHRAIGLAYGVDVDLSLNHGFNKESGKFLDEFVENGGIRFDAGDPDLNMDIGLQISSTVPLTKAQEKTIRDLVEWKIAREELFEANMTEENFLYEGPLAIRIDFGGNSNYAVGSVSTKDLSAWGKKSLEYEGGQIDANRIIADIRHYYKTGETRKPSLVAQFHYSDRDAESVSNRSLLANAFDGIAKPEERELVEKYKANVENANNAQARLNALNQRIKELSFAKGKRDTEKIEELRKTAKGLSDLVSKYDKVLLKLEASKPLQDVLAREKKLAYKRAEEKGKQALADYKAKVEAQQKETAEKWRESRKTAVAKARETAEKRDARAKLQKLVLDTVQWISYPAKTDVKCPDILKKPYEAFLQGIDLSSKRLANGGEATNNDLRLANAMDSLATAIDRVMLSQDPAQEVDKVLDIGYLDLPAGFVKNLRDMTEDIKSMMVEGEYVVNNMTAAEVRQLSQMIRTLNHAIKTMSKLYANLRFANVEALGFDTIDFLDAIGEIEETGGMGDFVQWDNALPYYAFKRFGKGGESIFEGLMDAQDKLAFLAKVIFDFQEKTWTGKEAKAWSEDTHTIDLPHGNKLTLTTADAMSIYCLSRREHALPHLLGGGIRVMGIEKGSKKAKDSRSLLTIQDVDAIISSLTDRQKQAAEGIQEFMSTVCSEWGNEISMKRFMTREFNEKFYFPIESNDENLPTKDPAAQQSDLFRLLNISATKPLTEGANNEVIIRNIFDVFTSHASDMARLNAYGMGLLDYMKWLNYRERGVNEEGQINVKGVRKSMKKAYGKAANSYVLNLIKDVNGRASDGGDPGILMKWMRSAKTASVGSSFRVATLQITSYPRAALVLSPKSLALGFKKIPNVKRAKKYCGIALWKSFGFYDTNISRSIEDQMKGVKDIKQKLIELSLKGAEWGDAITWGCLWNACEYEVAQTTTNKVGSEEFYQEVGKKLREVVYRTQVVDSTLTRSQIMRSKRGMAQEATAFMSEPTLSANILMDAGFEFSLEKRRTGSAKAAWKKTGSYIGRAIAVYSIGQLTAALLEAFWDAWRDDEDEEFWKKYLSAFATNLTLDILPLNKLPIISGVADAALSIFGLGYFSTDSMYSAWLSQTVSAVSAWKKVFSGESSTTVYNALYKSARAASSMLGISFSGAMREGVALWNNTAGAYDSTWKIRTEEPSKTAWGDQLYDAIMDGNDRQAKSIRKKFVDKDGKYDASAERTAIRKALRKNDPRIREAAKAHLDGDMRERVSLLKQVIADGFSQADVTAAVNAEIDALRNNR
jgi:hypothetical protein